MVGLFGLRFRIFVIDIIFHVINIYFNIFIFNIINNISVSYDCMYIAILIDCALYKYFLLLLLNNIAV